jgi:hypothetical protein
MTQSKKPHLPAQDSGTGTTMAFRDCLWLSCHRDPLWPQAELSQRTLSVPAGWWRGGYPERCVAMWP